MKVKNTGKTPDNTNYKLFNVTLKETENGLKVVDAFGSQNGNSKLKKLNSRYFARALKSTNLVTK
jgi:hypothetical protein